ncbi:MAG: carbohydrate ABC transporter permease [Ilumatobacteraceae bacterium]|nr:carbohydrate ABC transporter permease [Ilumatobacteraceae bacterium]
MTATINEAPPADLTPIATKVARKVSSPVGRAFVWLLAALWTVPTTGLLISSFRPEQDIKSTGWWTFFTNPSVTLENYSGVLDNKVNGLPFSDFFWNTVRIAIPAAIIPITIAAFAAYAFSWMKFKGRDLIFVLVVGLMVVPLQMCLIPLLQFFGGDFFPDQLEGVTTIWIAHAIFGMPLAIFLLKNFIGSLPSEVIEAARVDGASHLTIFVKIVLPLSVPALASLAIFQFLWVWNDLLVAKVFGGGAESQPMTFALVDMVGNRGNEWQLLTAGAFVTMIVPLIVFLSLQRYFVRGLLAGSVKG